jgi:hypothetical protein
MWLAAEGRKLRVIPSNRSRSEAQRDGDEKVSRL